MIRQTDPLTVDFGPCSCGFQLRPPEADGPAWAFLSAYDDCTDWREENSDLFRETVPTVGTVVPLKLSYPFTGRVGEAFWCTFISTIGRIEGLLDAPNEASEMRLVRVRLLSIEDGPGTKDPFDWKVKRQATVEVIGVLSIDDLIALPPSPCDLATSLDRVDWTSIRRWERGGLHYIEVDLADLVSRWAIWLERDDAAHLLLLGNPNDSHTDAVHAGHGLLTPADHRLLKQGLTERRREGGPDAPSSR